MFKYILFIGTLLAFNANAETNKLELQRNILKANGLNLFISTAPFDTVKNITPELIASGIIKMQFNSNSSIELKTAIEEFEFDKNKNLIINKEGIVFNVYRYKDDIKVLSFSEK